MNTSFHPMFLGKHANMVMLLAFDDGYNLTLKFSLLEIAKLRDKLTEAIEKAEQDERAKNTSTDTSDPR